MSVYKNWAVHRNEPYAVGGISGALPFLKLIPADKKRVLVIGCGEGHEVNWLVRHGHQAIGITLNRQEAVTAAKKYGVKVLVADMHELPRMGKFDAIFASNVLEHSPMPFLALFHWRSYLKPNGWLIITMPSREWLGEYYHYSVLSRPQVKDLLHKAGYRLLAGPGIKPLIDYRGGDIFLDLGRLWGFNDGYVAALGRLPKTRRMLGDINPAAPKKSRLLRTLVKWPYNRIRIWYARRIREW